MDELRAHALLGVVQEAETPEERDRAWDELKAALTRPRLDTATFCRRLLRHMDRLGVLEIDSDMLVEMVSEMPPPGEVPWEPQGDPGDDSYTAARAIHAALTEAP